MVTMGRREVVALYQLTLHRSRTRSRTRVAALFPGTLSECLGTKLEGVMTVTEQWATVTTMDRFY